MNYRTQKKEVAPTRDISIHLTITSMLKDSRKDFSTKAVLARLDEGDAADRVAVERRFAKWQENRVDLGEP